MLFAVNWGDVDLGVEPGAAPPLPGASAAERPFGSPATQLRQIWLWRCDGLGALLAAVRDGALVASISRSGFWSGSSLDDPGAPLPGIAVWDDYSANWAAFPAPDLSVRPPVFAVNRVDVDFHVVAGFPAPLPGAVLEERPFGLPPRERRSIWLWGHDEWRDLFRLVQAQNLVVELSSSSFWSGMSLDAPGGRLFGLGVRDAVSRDPAFRIDPRDRPMRLVETASLKVRFDLLPTDAGGRHGPILPEVYRPLFRLGGIQSSCRFDRLARTPMSPGDSGEAMITLVDPGRYGDDLRPGARFEMVEGARTVGRGEIIEVLR